MRFDDMYHSSSYDDVKSKVLLKVQRFHKVVAAKFANATVHVKVNNKLKRDIVDKQKRVLGKASPWKRSRRVTKTKAQQSHWKGRHTESNMPQL